VKRDETGGAMIELALSLPLLILVMFSVIDFARVFHASIGLTNAARAGAQYGASTLARSSDLAGMQTTAVAATNVTGVTAVASRLCQCATDAGVFSPTVTSANDCASAEAAACPGAHRVLTVTVVTSRTFSLIVGNLPGIPNNISLSRSATLRVLN